MGTGGGDLLEVGGIQIPVFEQWAGDRHGQDYVTYLRTKLGHVDAARARLVAELKRAEVSVTVSNDK